MDYKKLSFLPVVGFFGVTALGFSTFGKKIYGNLIGREEYKVYDIIQKDSTEFTSFYVQSNDGKVYKISARSSEIPKQVRDVLEIGGAEPSWKWQTRKKGVSLKELKKGFSYRWSINGDKLGGSIGVPYLEINPGEWQKYKIKVNYWNSGKDPYKTVLTVSEGNNPLVKYVGWGPMGRQLISKKATELQRAKKKRKSTILPRYSDGASKIKIDP